MWLCIHVRMYVRFCSFMYAYDYAFACASMYLGKDTCTYLCMYVCMYLCNYVSMRVCMCMYVCEYLCVYASVQVIDMPVCVHLCMSVCKYACKRTNMCAFMHVNKYLSCIYTNMYEHILIFMHVFMYVRV